MTLRILIFLALAIVACKSEVAPTTDTPPPQSQTNNFNQLQQQIVLTADSINTDPKNFKGLFESHLVSSDGSVRVVSDSVALTHGQKLLSEEPNEDNSRPVFKVRDTSHVVLLIVDGNQAATVLVDEQSRVILNMRFMPGFKTDQLRDKKVKFEQQFSGLSIDFTEDNFNLMPWEGELGPDKIQVDGISGATPICQASLDMLNKQFPFYRDYFLTQ